MEYKQMILNNGVYDENRDVLACKSIGGDEYYTLPKHAKDLADSLIIQPNVVIWCPFDTEESEIVKALKERGWKVIATHIKNGQDFFETLPPKDCGAIISNPPFSKKKEVLTRIKKLNIPFALILPCLWLNDGIPFDYGNQMLWWRKRVHFMTEQGEMNKPRTTCFVLSNGLLKDDLKIIKDNFDKNKNL